MNITTKKFSTYFCILLMAVFTMAACSGEDGEPGPEGPQGPIGPIGSTGQTGNTGPAGQDGEDGEDADVTQYNYPAFTHTGTDVVFSIPISTTEASESLIFAYTFLQNANWYPIPGRVLSSHEYRSYIRVDVNPPSLTMRRVEGTTDQAFTAFRILVIPAITVTNGKTRGVNFDNYEEVAEFYGIVN